MSNGSNHCLDVYLAKSKVGRLCLATDTDNISLEYDQAWKQSGFALSPFLPLEGKINTTNITRFLKNLIPEGNGLEIISINQQISKSNTFGLIRVLGDDTASGLSFLPIDKELDEKSNFRPITEKELIERLDDSNQGRLVIWDGKPRLSVAGVQDKINVVVDENGNIGLGDGTLCSTHILKFEKLQKHLVLNEYIMMVLCKKIGLPVAEVELRRYGNHPALLVTRFDRKRVDKHHVKRRYVIDGCQALNLPPENKYERNLGSNRDVKDSREGASLIQLFSLCQQAIQPAAEKLRLLDLILFNLCINNHDAHGKNFSYFLNAKSLHLAPAYDLVNIEVYPEFNQEMAMVLGDEFDSKTVNAYQLADFADSCKLSRKLVATRLKLVCNKLLVELDKECFSDIAENKRESDFINILIKSVVLKTKHLLLESQGITQIEI